MEDQHLIDELYRMQSQNASLQSEIDRLKEEKKELIEALESIKNVVEYQSSGYARSVSILANNLLTRLKQTS